MTAGWLGPERLLTLRRSLCVIDAAWPKPRALPDLCLAGALELARDVTRRWSVERGAEGTTEVLRAPRLAVAFGLAHERSLGTESPRPTDAARTSAGAELGVDEEGQAFVSVWADLPARGHELRPRSSRPLPAVAVREGLQALAAPAFASSEPAHHEASAAQPAAAPPRDRPAAPRVEVRPVERVFERTETQVLRERLRETEARASSASLPSAGRGEGGPVVTGARELPSIHQLTSRVLDTLERQQQASRERQGRF